MYIGTAQPEHKKFSFNQEGSGAIRKRKINFDDSVVRLVRWPHIFGACVFGREEGSASAVSVSVVRWAEVSIATQAGRCCAAAAAATTTEIWRVRWLAQAIRRRRAPLRTAARHSLLDSVARWSTYLALITCSLFTAGHFPTVRWRHFFTFLLLFVAFYLVTSAHGNYALRLVVCVRGRESSAWFLSWNFWFTLDVVGNFGWFFFFLIGENYLT